MIEKNTVLVLGAGASAPYGFPTGKTLKTQILEKFNGSSSSEAQMLQGAAYRLEDQGKFAEDFFISQQPSIDAFLQSRTDYLGIGQAAIAVLLMAHEDKKRLHEKAPVDEEHWYQYLWQRMGPTLDEFKKSVAKLTIISFNYDRSLEYYLYETITRAYKLGKEDASRILNALGILHVYGVLGEPHFMRYTHKEYGDPKKYYRDYEQHNDGETIRRAASALRIASGDREEGLNDELSYTSVQDSARAFIGGAEMLCFVGFGYDPVNLRLLDVVGSFDYVGDGQRSSWPFGTSRGVEIDVMRRAFEALRSSETKRTIEFGEGNLIDIVARNKNQLITDYLKEHLVLG